MKLVEFPQRLAEVRVAHSGPVVVSCFYTWPTPKNLRVVTEAQLTVTRMFGKCVSLTVIPPIDTAQLQQHRSAQDLTNDARDHSVRASAESGSELEAVTQAAAMVIMPRGLVAILVNAFMVALALMNTSKTPIKTFRTIGEATTWLGEQRGEPMPELEGAVVSWLGLAPSDKAASGS